MSTGYNRIKHLIGLCPQEIVVWEQLTGLEQLKFAGMCYGLTRGEAAAKAHRLLEGLGLSPHKHKLARALSGGMQRRLNLALGLVHDPELIILDEPQAGLDPQSKILVRDFIRQLGKRKTVILTTHDMDEADRLSDRIAIMDHGRILAAGTPQALKEQSGTGDLIQIRTTGISRDGAERLFRALPAVFTERSFTDGLLLLGARDVMEHIPLLTQTLKTLRIPIDDMTIRKRTLEDAFIAMTGRGLRE